MSEVFTSVEIALDALRQGKMVILVDDEHRENEGDLVFSAEQVTPEAINFMLHHARGLICLAMTQDFFDRLGIYPMVAQNKSKNQTAFGVSIGAKTGITTGISAQDRAHTIAVAVSTGATAEDLVMPGHIFPLSSRTQGVFERLGHTEGSTDLMRLAGLKTAAVICEIMNPDGTMARLPALQAFSQHHGIPLLSVQAILRYRMRHESYVALSAQSCFSIPGLGQFEIFVFRSQIDQKEHVALKHVNTNLEAPVLVRLHSECLTGDVFLSMRCDCGDQLYQSLRYIAQEGGVLLYLRQEGRGIGLSNKIQAYALQDAGYDTVEANERLGFAADDRDYSIAAKILEVLSIKKIRLLTNNPKKVQGLVDCGILVEERVALQIPAHGENAQYLKTKQEKLGHFLNTEE